MYTFVTHGPEMYEREFLIHNVHLLIDLADNADIYGPLGNISRIIWVL